MSPLGDLPGGRPGAGAALQQGLCTLAVLVEGGQVEGGVAVAVAGVQLRTWTRCR